MLLLYYYRVTLPFTISEESLLRSHVRMTTHTCSHPERLASGVSAKRCSTCAECLENALEQIPGTGERSWPPADIL